MLGTHMYVLKSTHSKICTVKCVLITTFKVSVRFFLFNIQFSGDSAITLMMVSLSTT